MTRARAIIEKLVHKAVLRFLYPYAPGAIRFRCNLCGTDQAVSPGRLTRETVSCWKCSSNIRFRSLVHLLSMELFGVSLLLTDFPLRKDCVGIGLSDDRTYARGLEAAFAYTNTSYDLAPKLDILSIDPRAEGSLDFLIASDVFEHVPPPVQAAFRNAHRLLKPDGLFVLTVPYRREGETEEHFPSLYDWRLVKSGRKCVLSNTTREGVREVFDTLTFHEGRGLTLEMRVFSLTALIQELERAGFRQIRVCREPHESYGIYWSEADPSPILARA